MKLWQGNGAVHMGGNFREGLSISSSSRGSERRRNLRLDVVNQQLVTIDLGADNGGLLLDLSVGGVAIQTVAPLKSGAASPFAFRLPQSDSEIEGSGVFVWVDDTKLTGGLRFDKLSPQGKQLVEQWLKDSPAESDSEANDPFNENVATASAPEPLSDLGQRNPALAATLLRMAERARIISRSKGAGIALKNDQGAFFCEASIGTAPDVGVRVNLDRGLTAECVASHDMIVCNEAQTDPRVDIATRQQLNLGSAALLPLFDGDQLFAVLSVFSDQPHAFGEKEILRLHDCARTMEKGIVRELRCEAEPVPALPTPVVVLPVPSAVAPEQHDERAISVRSVIRTLVVALFLGAVALSGVILYKKQVFAPAARLAPMPSAREPVRSQEVIAAPAAQVESNTVATPRPVESTAARPSPQQTPTRPVDSSQTAAPKEQRVPGESPGNVETVRTPDVTPSSARSTPPSAIPAAPTGSDATAPKASSQQNEVQGSPSAPPPVRGPAQSAPTATPHIEVLTEVLLSTPKSGAIAPPELLTPAGIAYPPAAVAQKREGSVVLRVTVGRAGTVDNVRVLDGDPVLTEQVLRSVRQWRYRSVGREAGTELLITINFVLTR